LRVSPEAEAIGLNISEHGAKTATYELFEVMDRQARHQDLTLRVPVEPFTEIGHIATRYNQVIDALERNHRENQESLEELYAITATAVSVVENQKFDPDSFAMFSDRGDELGILASSLQQILSTINEQQSQIQSLKTTQQDHWRIMLSEIFHYRFDQPRSFYQAQLQHISLTDPAMTIHQAFTITNFEQFKITYLTPADPDPLAPHETKDDQIL
jgi:Amt family ammonium transporter